MKDILICGDFAPTPSNYDLIINSNIDDVFGRELADVFREHKLSMINLEASLADIQTPKKKRGQIVEAPTACANFISKIPNCICCLANNHIIDNGNQGVLSTIEALDSNNIKHIGAAKTVQKAKECFEIVVGGKKVFIYNVSNYEFNKITEVEYGANTYDPMETYDDIEYLSRKCDFLIVVYHGGLEYYRYPTPGLQKICRKMVDKGAGLVTCQHSHCIGTYEEYKGKQIIYGQGNFLFDCGEDDMEKTAIILSIDIESEKASFIPVVKHNSVTKMANNSGKEILSGMEERHNEIVKIGFIEKSFEKYCIENQNEPLRTLVGYNKIYRAINRLTNYKLQKKIYNSKNRMRIYNVLETPVHFEVLEKVMSFYDKE